MGLATDNFDAFVVNIVKRHAPNLDDTAIRTRSSNNNKYVSVTVTIEAKSRDQLDAIYLELTASKRVLFAL